MELAYLYISYCLFTTISGCDKWKTEKYAAYATIDVCGKVLSQIPPPPEHMRNSIKWKCEQNSY